MDDQPQRPSRRPRYPGKNPRSFSDKYKEHQPEQYPEDVARIVQQGKTPAGMHLPIMVAEVLSTLQLQPGQTVLDCTLGYGGHAQALLAAVLPTGRLLGVDQDPLEFPKTAARLTALSPGQVVLQRMNFSGLAPFLAEHAPQGVDGILADLGVSSMQIDNPERGFSFRTAGPLDMRMNPQRGMPASDFLSSVSETELAALLVANGDEPHARRVAALIMQAHSKCPITSTEGLVAVLCQGKTKGLDEVQEGRVRRVFQALRIAVNEELRWLESFLRQTPQFLRPGGRVAILTFHSGEDRRVKEAFQQGLQQGVYQQISNQILRPSATEQFANPRSRCAKLRFAEKAAQATS